MDYSIQLKDLPAQLALQVNKPVTMETIGPAMGEAFQALMSQAEACAATYAGPPFVFYPEECAGEFPMVLCMPVAPGCGAPATESGVELADVPAVHAACVLHKGPYDKVGEAYGALQTWMTANGKTPSGPPREIYLNDPGQVPPAELLTEIAWPVD